MAKGGTGVTPKKAQEWRPKFLDALRNSANVRAACQRAGISRMTAYRAKEASPEFAAQWQDAIEDACDILEAEAFQRAHKQSDTLLIFLLKAHRPQKYRETIRQEHSGTLGTYHVEIGGSGDSTDSEQVPTLE